MRTVILHYHLFKNAGTSLDAAFKENFSVSDGEWVTKEFPAKSALNREQVKQWIIDNPQAKCFSSHTAIFPVPRIENVNVIPVIFFRHPIDRIASAYSFEKKQGGTGFGATLARNTTLAGYIETRLTIQSDRQCRNFHAHRLATMFGEKVGDEASRARKALERLIFIGLVENFNDSLGQLETLLKSEGFSNIKLKPVEANVSRTVKKSIHKKVAEIKTQVGDDIYSMVVDVNTVDLELWNHLQQKFKATNA